MDPLLHIKVDDKLRKRLQGLIDSGLFNNQSEIVREGLRDLIQRYSKEEQK